MMVGRSVKLTILGCALMLYTMAVCGIADAEQCVTMSSVAIIMPADADDLEMRVANVLKERIMKWSGVSVDITKRTATSADLSVYLGRTGHEGELDKLCAANGVKLPGRQRPAPEGYAVKTVSVDGRPAVLAVGVDNRGVLYAVGEVLRQLTYYPASVSVGDVDVSTAPAYRYRGSSANQGGTMMQVTKARRWEQEEWEEYILDLALSGANFFYAGGAGLDFVKSFDLMAETGARPNELRTKFPKEWQATERGRWVCPSVPDAHEALMKQWEEDLKSRPDYDVLRMFAGDPGGCRCDRCAPWGKTFIHLCEELANIWLEYHPDSVVMIANQDVNNAGDQAIFDYLNEEPREWLYAIAYGPGSNAMSDYFRPELREDLFEYPGSGPVNRYLAETLNQLPKQQRIVHYSDITHWISAQYQVENPEPHLMSVYGRRTFHTRPRAFYSVFQAIMPFSEGDIIYSEGYHDEFHQYMWNRLLWDPNRTLDDVMTEYCTHHFGADAVEPMKEALLQLEENLEAPLATNEGIDRYYVLVKDAGWKIPPNLMKENHWWRLYMQKAALDKYVQLKLQKELDKESGVSAALESGLRSNDLDGAIAKATAILDEPSETPDMKALRDEAGRLGEESEALFGVRNVGYFSLDKGLTGLAWLSNQIKAAEAAESSEEKRAVFSMVAGYEDPGEGGFYDDAGRQGRQPHLVKGDSYDAGAMLDPNNRPSQNTIAFNLEEDRGVVFLYTGLDTDASYKVRLTMVVPRIPRGLVELPEKFRRTQHIIADGEYIAKDVDVPEYTAKQFEYDIPKRLTEDGSLELALEKGTGAMATLVSEVWLIKKGG
jgi:hypothetical protein